MIQNGLISLLIFSLFSCKNEQNKSSSVKHDSIKNNLKKEKRYHTISYENMYLDSLSTYYSHFENNYATPLKTFNDIKDKWFLGVFSYENQYNENPKNREVMLYPKLFDSTYLNTFDSIKMVNFKENKFLIGYKVTKWINEEDSNLYYTTNFYKSLNFNLTNEEFTLIVPDTSKIFKEYHAQNEETIVDNIFLFYLEKFYGKKNLIESIDNYPYYNHCADYYLINNQIVFNEFNCGEYAFNCTINFPKVITTSLKKLIERLASNTNFSELKWISEYKYEPYDGGAGCYYEIIQHSNRSEIHYYCAC